MSRLVGVVVLILVGLFGVAAFLTWAAKTRAIESRVACSNNLRELGRFAADHARPPDRDNPRPAVPAPDEIPAGTAPNPTLPPDRRLSWVAEALPRFDQRRLPTALPHPALDPAKPWDAPEYTALARARLPVLLCPANPPDEAAGQPAVTQYVGLSGLDPGGADLGLGPPVPPHAGCFRYDAPTPFAAVTDGLSNTLLFGETSRDLGPWLRGGPATVRGLNPQLGPALGVGGQFGGNHAAVAYFGIADGSARPVSEGIDPAILRELMTIAGGTGPEVVGE